MRFSEINQQQDMSNPYPSSKIQQKVYHGSHARNTLKFNRPPEGVWFTDLHSWASAHYTGPTGEIYECFVDVRNPYYPTDDEVEEYYGEMDIIGEFFDQLREQGYDCYMQGGESNSIALLGNNRIYNTKTGKEM